METEVLLKRLREMLATAKKYEKRAESENMPTVAALYYEEGAALAEAIRHIEAA